VAIKRHNQKGGIPYSGGDGRGKPFSRSNFLWKPNQKVMFGSSQSLDVLSGQDLKDEAQCPQKWPNNGYPLRVPRCVIFSFFPQWTLLWQHGTFTTEHFFPGAFEEGVTPYYLCHFFNGTGDDVNVHAYYTLGHITSPWYQTLMKMKDIFREAKAILENRKDPIYAIIPSWVPEDGIYMYENTNGLGYLEENPARRDVDFATTTPCYLSGHTTFKTYSPNTDDDRNNVSPDMQGLAALFGNTMFPTFGTNVLHMYMGHPNIRFQPGKWFTGWEAWPYAPEGNWIAGLFGGNTYLHPVQSIGTPGYRANPLPNFHYPWGYPSVQGVYDYYKGEYEASANSYKNAWPHFRNLHTHIFSMPNAGIDVSLVMGGNDTLYCDDVRHFGGQSYADYCQGYASGDPASYCIANRKDLYDLLAVAELMVAIGSTQEDYAVANAIFTKMAGWYSDYYNGLEPGSEEVFKMIIEDYSLADYNVQHAGEGSMFFSAQDLASYVIDHFNKYPS